MTTISYIEITQALQENGAEVPDTGTAEHRPVPLLAGKRTLARVFLAADSGDDPGVRRLRGKLSIGLAGAEAVEISSSVQFTGLSAAGADHSVLRRDLANSLNFEFRLSTLFPDETAAATGPIAVELKLTALEIDDHWTVPQEKTVAARFEPGKQLKLQMLGLRYEDEDDTVYYPDAVHFANVKNSLENLYPINGCSSSHIVVDADLEFTPALFRSRRGRARLGMVLQGKPGARPIASAPDTRYRRQPGLRRGWNRGQPRSTVAQYLVLRPGRLSGG